MRPTETIGAWQTLQSLAPKATRDFMVVETETQEEEAAVIAVQLRQVLETEGKTACLVTTDRALARRVSSLMRVWDVVVDDSAGVPLLLTTPMVFVRLVAEAVQAQFAPMEMLALFKHPLCSAGQSAAAFRAEVRACEVALLRGPRVVGGLAGMIALLEEQKLPALAKWLERIHTLALSFSELFKEDHAPLKALLHAHLALAENLAATDTESGVMRLWGSEEGERAWEFLQALNASAPAFTRAEVCNYTKLLETLFAGAIYRKAYGQHPALTILSPIEARLLSFDMMILAGMNQGSWPVLESSAWMSRPMASQFGMNGSEIKLGLSAHDFVSFCFAREVMITRAAKVEGTPTMPSMWLMRLEVVLKKLGLKEQVYNGESLVNAAREYFTPKSEGMHGIAPPVANPPLGTRPHSIYATQFETLMRNPYLYYVRHLLKLRPLDTIDSEADAADLGSLIHAVIDSYTKQANIKPPASVGEGEVLFLQLAAEAFSRFEARPSIHTLWWPRIEAIAHWFVAYDTETRSTGRSIHSEILGEAEIKTEAGKTVELKAKADRLEIGKDGNVTLIDFKTGGLPTRADIQQGFSPQLLLEGLILAHAGFGTAVHGVPAEMIYYRLGNAFTSGDSVKAESGVANIQPEIVKILSAYLDEAHPYYARPFKDKSKNIKELDYIQRLDEWISPKSENNK